MDLASRGQFPERNRNWTVEAVVAYTGQGVPVGREHNRKDAFALSVEAEQ